MAPNYVDIDHDFVTFNTKALISYTSYLVVFLVAILRNQDAIANSQF